MIDEIKPNSLKIIENIKAHARLDCPQCHGAGFYMYDHNHGQPCNLCCQHDQGWWQLTEAYGKHSGKWCCKAGCGEMREQNPDAVTA